jgi:hypothetical protein
METVNKTKTNGLKDLKKKRDSPPKEIPKRNTSAGCWKRRGTGKGARWQPVNLLL